MHETAAQIVTNRKYLEAALANAEAALVDAVARTARSKGDRTEADAMLDQARANCRAAHAALVKLNRAKS